LIQAVNVNIRVGGTGTFSSQNMQRKTWASIGNGNSSCMT